VNRSSHEIIALHFIFFIQSKIWRICATKLGKHHGDHHQTFFFGNWQLQFREETLTLLLLLLTMLAGEREIGRVLLLLFL
jgi:hypothetical protein